MIQIYGLTGIGQKLAHSIRSPDTSEWRIIHFLDRVGRATKEQIIDYCGASPTEISVNLRKLKSRRIVAEESEVSVQ